MRNNMLYEKYRPKSFDKVLGQETAIKKIKRTLSRGWGGRAWWISGASGVGKTTLARIIANECLTKKPRVQLTEYDSANEFTTQVIQHIQRMRHGSLMPTVYIVNEAHGLKKPIIQSLLGILEPLHKDTVIIFTTTKAGQKKLFEDKTDAKPLLSRCTIVELTNQGLTPRFAKLCRKIAKKENLDGNKPISRFEKLARQCNNNCRQMLMEIESGCMSD